MGWDAQQTVPSGLDSGKDGTLCATLAPFCFAFLAISANNGLFWHKRCPMVIISARAFLSVVEIESRVKKTTWSVFAGKLLQLSLS